MRSLTGLEAHIDVRKHWRSEFSLLFIPAGLQWTLPLRRTHPGYGRYTGKNDSNRNTKVCCYDVSQLSISPSPPLSLSRFALSISVTFWTQDQLQAFPLHTRTHTRTRKYTAVAQTRSGHLLVISHTYTHMQRQRHKPWGGVSRWPRWPLQGSVWGHHVATATEARVIQRSDLSSGQRLVKCRELRPNCPHTKTERDALSISVTHTSGMQIWHTHTQTQTHFLIPVLQRPSIQSKLFITQEGCGHAWYESFSVAHKLQSVLNPQYNDTWHNYTWRCQNWHLFLPKHRPEGHQAVILLSLHVLSLWGRSSLS